MIQKIKLMLTLEVDSSQSLEDIKSFVNHAINKRATQHRIESKPYYSFKKVEKIEEKIEEEISVPSINIGMLDPKEILGKTIIDFSLDKDDDGEELIINLHDGKQIEVYFGSGDIMVASD